MAINETQANGFSPSLGLAEKIADYLQNQIVSGELEPGMRISEASITKELGVSRGPVRESMRILARRHLVELPPRKGARVSEFSADDVNGLYDLQKALMGLLLLRVFRCWKPEDLETFKQLKGMLENEAASGNALELIELSFKFQQTACDIVGNGYLASALEDLQPSFSRAYYRAMIAGQHEMRSLTDFIGDLIVGIVDGDLDKCQLLVEEYTEHQRQVVLQTFSQ